MTRGFFHGETFIDGLVQALADEAEEVSSACHAGGAKAAGVSAISLFDQFAIDTVTRIEAVNDHFGRFEVENGTGFAYFEAVKLTQVPVALEFVQVCRGSISALNKEC